MGRLPKRTDGPADALARLPTLADLPDPADALARLPTLAAVAARWPTLSEAVPLCAHPTHSPQPTKKGEAIHAAPTRPAP